MDVKQAYLQGRGSRDRASTAPAIMLTLGRVMAMLGARRLTPLGVCEGGRGEGAGAWLGWRIGMYDPSDMYMNRLFRMHIACLLGIIVLYSPIANNIFFVRFSHIRHKHLHAQIGI